MEKVLKIEGMHCDHCSKSIYDALSNVEGVENVKVSLFRKTAKVEGETLNEDNLKKAVEEAGFKVNSID